PRPVLEPKRVAPVAAGLDGQNGFGFVVGTRAMQEAIAIAREFGVGVVSVRRSTHFGMAAAYVLQALDAGFDLARVQQCLPGHAALGCAHRAPRHQSVRGRRAGGQASPVPARHVAGGCRARKDPPRRAPRRENFSRLCARRRGAADPRAALGGVVLPIGTYKGSGLSMLMDVFDGVISGANYGGGGGGPREADGWWLSVGDV